MNPQLAPVNPTLIHKAFLEAFADYAMDASGTTEEHLLLRMKKNCVDYSASPGAYIDDRLVGFTLIGLDTWGEKTVAYDAGTGMIPDVRGQGLAKRMFEHALPELHNRGVQKFVLEVLQGNDPAIKAYQKTGFAIARELKCFMAEVPTLSAIPVEPSIQVRSASATEFEVLSTQADWLPSFENRLTVHHAIPDEVEYYGAFDDDSCIGIVVYCRGLNWLLSLLIDRSHRRKGIGAQLLRHLAGVLPEGASRIAAINVDGEDHGMQEFFQSTGFKPLVDQYEMHLEL